MKWRMIGTAVIVALVLIVGFVAPGFDRAAGAGSGESRPAGQISFHIGGITRLVDVQAVGTTRGAPALIALHGTTQSAAILAEKSGLGELQRRDHFVLAFGQGTPSGLARGGYSWNAGGCCDAASRHDIDDIAYIDHVIRVLIDEYHVNPSRIYLAGFSNGAMMTYRYACEGDLPIAGFASVAGALNIEGECRPDRPTRLIEIHGTADRVVPYSGGPPNGRVTGRTWHNSSVAFSTSRWAEIDECTGPIEQHDVGTATVAEHEGCLAGTSVDVVTVHGLAHRWATPSEDGFGTSDWITTAFGLEGPADSRVS